MRLTLVGDPIVLQYCYVLRTNRYIQYEVVKWTPEHKVWGRTETWAADKRQMDMTGWTLMDRSSPNTRRKPQHAPRAPSPMPMG